MPFLPMKTIRLPSQHLIEIHGNFSGDDLTGEEKYWLVEIEFDDSKPDAARAEEEV